MGLASYLVGGTGETSAADEPQAEDPAIACARDAIRAAHDGDAEAFLTAVRKITADPPIDLDDEA